MISVSYTHLMDPANPKYDRLKLTEERLQGIAADMENVSTLPSPLNKVLSETIRPNGMVIRKVTVPFGVIGVIYEMCIRDRYNDLKDLSRKQSAKVVCYINILIILKE